MHARRGFMLLEAIISLLLFSLIISLFLIEKPTFLTSFSMKNIQHDGEKTLYIKQGNIELEVVLGVLKREEEKYVYFEDVR